MRHFSLYKRGKYYYCQFRNPVTGKYMSGRSTRQTTRDMAAAVAATWQQTGESEDTGSYNVEHRIALDTILTFARSEHITSDDVASLVKVLQDRSLLASASLTSDDAPPFMDFLAEFWDYERSPYIREKLAHNQSITRRTCYDRGLAIKNYWKKLFPQKRLDEVTKKDLRAFALTVNQIMAAGTIALRWAYENDLIPSNPADG